MGRQGDYLGEKTVPAGSRRSFLHIPLNFGAVMKRNMAAIEAAGAATDEMIVLSDENSLWGADVYIAVAKDVPGPERPRCRDRSLPRCLKAPIGTCGIGSRR